MDFLDEKEQAFVDLLLWEESLEVAALKAELPDKSAQEVIKDFLTRDAVRKALVILWESRREFRHSDVMGKGWCVKPESEIPDRAKPHYRPTRDPEGNLLTVDFSRTNNLIEALLIAKEHAEPGSTSLSRAISPGLIQREPDAC